MNKYRLAFFLTLIAFVLLLPARSSAQSRAVFIVDTTNNAADDNLLDNACLTSGGKCSLRAAIQQANAIGTAGSPHSIIFDIPGAGPHVIPRTTHYEIISVPIMIDGTTESGASCPTSSTAGTFQIEIDATGYDFGLRLDSADNSIIRGLKITGANLDGVRFEESDNLTIECNQLRDNGQHGIQAFIADQVVIGGNVAADRNLISGNGGSGVFVISGSNVTVRNNYIGTRSTGSLTDGNGEQGVFLDAKNVVGAINTIEENVISANGLNGIIVSKNSLLTTILNNNIGTDVTGSADLGNDGAGIVVLPPFADTIDGAVQIGGVGDENIIAHNGRVGIAVVEDREGVENDDHVAIRANSIYDNTGLGIDLNSLYNYLTGVVGGDGVTANDDLDPDDGANQSQNFPSVDVANVDGSIRVSLNAAPSHFFEVDIYLNTNCHTSGFGEGETYLATVDADTSASGVAVASYTHGSALPVGSYITAVATDVSNGAPNNDFFNNTSEFSECRQIVQDIFTVDSTADDADSNLDDNQCRTASGDCTLRAAIEQANDLNIPYVQIEFDLDPFASIFLTSQLHAVTVPVLLDGATNDFIQCPTGVDDIPLQLVRIVGSPGIADGIRLAAGSDGSTIRALEIYKFDDDGIQIASHGNTVVCSIIGRSFDPNGGDGLNISGDSNKIGGGGAQSRNVIVGNLGEGIQVQAADGESADGNRIVGNFIGLATQSNASGGILLGSNSSRTTIGGSTAGARNVIGGNIDYGIQSNSSSDNTITGNYVGLSADGTTAAPNTSSGIFIENSSNTTIGGSDETLGNYIANNGDHGIQVDNSTMTVINENTIGSAVDRATAGNDGSGVFIQNGSTNNQVAYNRIRNNGGDGVRVTGATSVSNPIRYNSISDNGSGVDDLGIDLGGNGITQNDGAGDPDSGSNNLQNYPEIDSVTVSGGGANLSFTGTMTGNLGDVIRIDIYHNDSCDGTHGEGKTYLGSYDFTMTADQNIFGSTLTNTNISSGEITMTATGPGSNTSEFSACATLGTPTSVQVSSQSTHSRYSVLIMVWVILFSVTVYFGARPSWSLPR